MDETNEPDLVEVAEFTSLAAAEDARLRLGGSGIEATLVGGEAFRIGGHGTDLGDRTRVMVPKEEAERALEILALPPLEE